MIGLAPGVLTFGFVLADQSLRPFEVSPRPGTVVLAGDVDREFDPLTVAPAWLSLVSDAARTLALEYLGKRLGFNRQDEEESCRAAGQRGVRSHANRPMHRSRMTQGR